MTYTDQAIQRFREKFNCSILEDMSPHPNPDPMNADIEAFLRQELTDFAREVEEKVIGLDDDDSETYMGMNGPEKYDWPLNRNELRKEQRQALHQLIGEEGQNAPKIT